MFLIHMFHIIICHVMKVKRSVALGARGVAHTRSLKRQQLSFQQNLDPKSLRMERVFN